MSPKSKANSEHDKNDQNVRWDWWGKIVPACAQVALVIIAVYTVYFNVSLERTKSQFERNKNLTNLPESVH